MLRILSNFTMKILYRISLSEKLTALLVGCVTLAAFGLTTYLDFQRQKIQERYTSQNFHRAVVLDVVPDEMELHGDDARNLISSTSNISSGARAVLSRESASRLQSMPEVFSVMAFTRTQWQLEFPSSMSAEISLYNVPQEFAQIFHLGDTTLREGVLVPSRTLAAHFPAGHELSAVLSIPKSEIESMPEQMRTSIDWSAARVPVKVDANNYDVPSESEAFRSAVFSTGHGPQVSIPGFYSIPSVRLIVILNENVDLKASINRLQQFAISAKLENGSGRMIVIPATEYFSSSLDQEVTNTWSSHAILSSSLSAALILMVICLAKLPTLYGEIQLRRFLGFADRKAIWHSLRQPFVSALFASVASSIFGIGLALRLGMRIDSSQLVTVAVLGLSVLLSYLIIAGFSMVVGKK